MPQDAFHIRRLKTELKTELVGGKINRISQVNKDELTFIIYTGKRTVKLIFSTNASGARVCLSATEKEPAPIAPNFCMLLRKHLLGAEILDVRQYAFERLIEIDFHCTTDFSECTRTLYCELMGKYSNLVLTEKDIIMGALKSTPLDDGAHRILLTGAKYLYPAPQDKISPFDGAGMRSRLENYLSTRTESFDLESLSLFIFENVSGLAMPTAREIVRRAEEKYGNLKTAFTSAVEQPFWAFVGDFCENEPCNPHVIEQNGIITDFFAFEVANGKKMPSLMQAEDEYYTRRENKKGFEDKKRKLENSVRGLKKKQAKKLQETIERLKDAEKAEDYRIKGELLTANLYKIERGMQSVTLENWYSPECEPIKISLDSTLSPAKNAQKYFKTYTKYKRAKEILTPMLKTEQDEIAYTSSVEAELRQAEQVEDLKEIETELIDLGLLRAPKERAGVKKKEQAIPFREFHHDGHTIYVGRNNIQNDRLLKLASPNDVWLHTQKYHSSHVIIIEEGGQVRDETILYAAELCAYYSDGRDSDKIPVDYCLRKHVKKPSKSKAGFVTYTDYKTILVKPTLHV